MHEKTTNPQRTKAPSVNGKRPYPALAALVLGLLAGILLLTVGQDEASAQEQIPLDYTDGIDRAERLRVFREISAKTKSADPVTRNASRRVMGRAFAKASKGSLGRAATRACKNPAGCLVAGNVVVWGTVAYQLKYALEGPTVETFKSNMEIRAHPNSASASAVWPEKNTSAVAFIESVQWNVDAGGAYKGRVVWATYASEYRMTDYGGCQRWDAYAGDVQFVNVGGANSNMGTDCTDGNRTEPTPEKRGIQEIAGNGASGLDRRLQITNYANMTGSYASNWYRTEPRDSFGPALCGEGPCESNHTFPTILTGEVAPTDALSPSAPQYTSEGAEADTIVDSVVTDPEAPTVVPELPPADDPFWTDPNAPQDPGEDPAYPDPEPERQAPPADDPFYEPPQPDEPGYDPVSPGADPDQDGTPNEQDGDDDGDGIPDEADPSPNVPTSPEELPADNPYADPDGDGLPNKDDPDDDNDGDPDTNDPAPQDPNVESPDTDGDGVPDHQDDDDDNDGTPDPQDPAPKDPTENGDLDKDGILDPSDGDQDGDGIADWEDVGPRSPASPDRVPDLDGDGVPDWSDPWPGNPYAPADPVIDGDLDKVPDYKDPVITDPLVPTQPWPPGSPGDKPGNPGQPNIPTNPENPNYPTSPNMPAQPSDPTSPISPTAPISPNQPMPPGEPGGPPATETPTETPPGPTPQPPGGPTDSAACAVQPPVQTLRGPGALYASLFPFNLLLAVIGTLNNLDAAPITPVLPPILPNSEPFDLTPFDGIAGLIRQAFTVVGILGACLMGYKLVSQSKEGD